MRPDKTAPASFLRRVPVKASGACVAIAAAIGFSADWCFSAVLACIAALVVVSLLDALLKRAIPAPSHWHYVLRLGIAIAASAAIGANMPLSRDWAFQEAFGVACPDGVQDLKLLRHYEGGPGEHTLLMEFYADETAVRAITSQRPFVQDSEEIREWIRQGAGWSDAFERFDPLLVFPFSRRSWHRIPPVNAPQVFWWSYGVHSTLLLRDHDWGRAVVLHSRK